jgi:hypothetical protein
LGTSIYVHDSAASRATDELIRRGFVDTDKRIRGWITAMNGSADAVIVTFVGDVDGTPHALYRVSVPPADAEPGFEVLKPAQSLTHVERALYAARTLAIADLKKQKDLCAETYNTVVLPLQRQGDPVILVYALAATDKPGVVVAGGHIRYSISADGARIEGQRTFTKSCMVMSPDDAADPKNVEAMVLTHLLDPVPTEIHVFLSRLHKRPFYIGTSMNQLVWKVDGSVIQLMDTK